MKRFFYTMRALRYKNYRLFFGGQAISLIGTWMTNTASSWLVYRLTGSAFLLGVVGFATQFPGFLMAPVAGVLVDRWDRHRMLITCQVLSMLQSFALAFLTLSGRITYSAIIFLSFFQGLVNAFDIPCRQSFVVAMVEDKEDLGNAIALNSSMFNAARLVGPSLAGIVIAMSNEGWCFLFDGISYIAVIVALLAMTVTKRVVASAEGRGVLTQFKEGWRYTSRSMPIRSIISLLAIVSLLGAPYGVLMPVFASRVLHGGAHTLGFLMAASGCGAMLGALWLAARRSVKGLGHAVPAAGAVFGAALIAFALSNVMWFSLIAMVFAGGGFMIQMASSNTILQTIVEDDKRGRVMSFFIMSFLGTAPLGALLFGSLGDRIGAPRTLMIGGIACILSAAWFAKRLITSITAETIATAKPIESTVVS